MAKTTQSLRIPRLAYIDGGLAAMLVQGAAGAVLGGLLYFKIGWRTVKSWFGGNASEAATPQDKNDPGA